MRAIEAPSLCPTSTGSCTPSCSNNAGSTSTASSSKNAGAPRSARPPRGRDRGRGSTRIYTFGEPWQWDGRWLVVVVRVPENRRAVCHQLRSRFVADAWDLDTVRDAGVAEAA
jgi:hypothetical protein